MVIDIREQIASDTKYISLCKKISESDDWKDLYQDFMVTVLDPKNEKNLLNAKDVVNYCYVTIYNLWSRRKNKIKYTGKKSPLYQITDNPEDLKGYREHLEFDRPSRSEVELKNKLILELHNLLKSEDPKTRKQAEYLKAYCEGENRLQIAKRTGVNYKIIHESIETAIIKVKSKMNNSKIPPTKTEINITLRNEGCKASYSGKDRTFYVDRMPVAFIVKEIESAGFKVVKQ